MSIIEKIPTPKGCTKCEERKIKMINRWRELKARAQAARQKKQ